MNIHELKTWPEYFEKIWNGTKLFELRKNDRAFLPQDFLKLREYNPSLKTYTGRIIEVRITYVFIAVPGFGLWQDWCILSLSPQMLRSEYLNHD